ncbi:MAG: hypothetical protein M1133_11200 [Armatimonadetes bacterium]|nr:hypothetical protein [Armatimonadota bacterium]
MTVVDSALTREVLRDISKRPVDISGLEVHAMHGVVHLRGRMEKLRGYYGDIDIHEELNIILKLLRQKPGVREIVCEVDLAGPSLTERLSPTKKRGYY